MNVVEVRQSLHGLWSSKWAFILASAGAAIGLGNIWRFPYMAGTNGGSLFVLLYFLFVAVLGFPLMMAEILLGRRGRRNPVDSMLFLCQEAKCSPRWQIFGWWGLTTLVLILAFYSVVSGWSLAYLFKTLSGQFTQVTPTQVKGIWLDFLGHPVAILFWHSVFIFLTMWVGQKGVQKGLEAASKMMMPVLYLVLFILVIYGATQPGFTQAFHFLFDPDFSKITTGVVIDAMGHAFFTLALGVGALLTYGAYTPKGISITQSVVLIGILDVLVAVLSGLAIFPLVFTYHLPPQSGSGLMFVSLPIAFAQMSWGLWVGVLFFVLLLFASWTSSINLAEPVMAILIERLGWKRTKAAWVVGLVAWTVGVLSALSFNVLKDVRVFQWGVFDIMTGLPTNLMLPLGGLMIALFVGWVMPKSVVKDEIAITRETGFALWYALLRYFSPIAILAVFISAF